MLASTMTNHPQSIGSTILDYLLTQTCRGLSSLACALPYGVIKNILYVLLKAFFIIQPKHLRIAHANLKIAFPDRAEADRNIILRKHIGFLARVLTDSLRLQLIDEPWAREHISFPNEELHRGLKSSHHTGALIITGHLGSFELFGYASAILGHKLAFVVRNFPFPQLDDWWCKTRERPGNTVIRRKGAYKQIIEQLQNGGNVALLFDQNVTLSRAVFPKWFGLEAATTKAVAYAALKIEAPLVVATLAYQGDSKHTILWKQISIEEIRGSQELSREEKLLKITQLASDTFCEWIAEYPEQWLWSHRRWKTRPDGSKFPY